MARQIKETPILFGKDARRFEERMHQTRVTPKEDIERIKRHYLIVKEWMKKGEEYEAKFRTHQSQTVEA